MTKLTSKDAKLVSWDEFDELVESVIEQMSDYFNSRGEKLHVIAPLLRTGGIVGGIVSIKMKILTMLPVQFKYSYNPTVINQMISVPDILTKITRPINILLTEGNTSTGSIAVKAAAVIKEKYPESKIYLATLTKVFGGSEKLEGIEEIFVGRTTDENKKASRDEIEKFGLREGITIFPWENVDDELSDINAGTGEV